MNQSKMLNYLLGTTSKVEVLRVLFESDDAMTGRRIASTAGISPRSCQLSLDNLVKNKALSRKAIGRAYSYKLNREHKMVWELLAHVFEEEKNMLKKTCQVITKNCRPINNSVISIFYDLSMMKKSETFRYVVVTKGKQESRGIVAKIDDEIERQFGYKVKGEIVPLKDFTTKYFTSEAAKKRFNDKFTKLKGETFANLFGKGKG